MRILVISQYFFPENFRINDLVFSLNKRGHNVEVLTGKPNYPKGEYFNGYSWTKPKFEKINGIKICRQAKSYWNEKFDKRVNPLGKNYYWLTGNFVNLDDGQDTDHWALENDYISVVPIQFDLTAHSYLKNLKSWNFE